MIELLLQAERALSAGLADQAERMYRQAVAADPRNAIAVVGLARVALERADDAEAYRMARRALGIDPENVAARRLVGRLEEVYAQRGLPVPGTGPVTPPETAMAPEPEPEVEPEPKPTPVPVPVPEPEPEQAPEPEPEPSASPSSVPSPSAATTSRSFLDRLLRRTRP